MGELRHSAMRLREGAERASPVAYTPPTLVADATHQFAHEAATKSFIDELYGAAIEFPLMAKALAAFARAFDADEAVLFATEPGAKPKTLQSSRDDAADLAEALAEDVAPRRHVHSGSLKPPSARRPAHHLTVTTGETAQGTLGLSALRAAGAFSDSERARAHELVPDIHRALELRRRAAQVEATGFALHVFDHNPIAVLVTRHRMIERTNAAAAALLADGRPIGAVSGRLFFEDSRAHAAFELLSRGDGHANGVHSFALVVEGTGERTWIAQLAHARGLQPCSASAVVVALTPFNAASQTREAMLNGFTDLTPTERTIFAAFVDGYDIASIAARLNRSVETVRWHVRNLFTKLGVNSQADLARLGALLLPI